jgi:hypothetical protein
MAADDLGGANARAEAVGSQAQGLPLSTVPDGTEPQTSAGPVTATEVLRYVVAHQDGPPQTFEDARSAAQAFLAADVARRPFVIRLHQYGLEAERATHLALARTVREGGEARLEKALATQADPVFAQAYREILAAQAREPASRRRSPRREPRARSETTPADGFTLDGERVTAIRYRAAVQDGRAVQLELTFLDGAARIGSFRGDRPEIAGLIGEANLAQIESAASERDSTVRGQLKGGGPHPWQARVSALSSPAAGESSAASVAEENGIEQAERSRQGDATAARMGAPGPAVEAQRPDSVPGEPFPATPHRRSADEPLAPQGSATRGDGVPAEAALSPQSLVPPHIAQRFVQVKDRFYFPDQSLAFIDRGTRLNAQTENLEVIRGLVDIAEARGWQALRVTGTERFRARVWGEAARRGITIRGYVPSEVERAKLERELGEREGPILTPLHRGGVIVRQGLQAERVPPARDGAQAPGRTMDRDAGGPADPGPPSRQAPGLLFGKLLASGEAPYRFQEGASPSCFLRLATDQGERVLWGKDFPRALAEAQSPPQVGDLVGVQSLGRRPVTVKVPVRGEDGAVSGFEDVAAHRNTWLVEAPAFFEARHAREAALRDPGQSRGDLARSHPELAAAIAWLHLAERLAQSRIADPDDQQRFVAMVREGLAQAVGRSEAIPAPKLRVVAQRPRKVERTPEKPDRVRVVTEQERAAIR